MRGKKSFFSLSLIPSFSSLPFDSLYPFLSRFSFSCLPLTFYLFLNIHISFTQSLFIFSLFSFVLISSFTLFPIHIHMIIRIFFFFFFLIRYISFSFLFFSVYIYIYLFNFFFSHSIINFNFVSTSFNLCHNSKLYIFFCTDPLSQP